MEQCLRRSLEVIGLGPCTDPSMTASLLAYDTAMHLACPPQPFCSLTPAQGMLARLATIQIASFEFASLCGPARHSAHSNHRGLCMLAVGASCLGPFWWQT